MDLQNTALVIDSDPHSRQRIASLLTGRHYRVTGVARGEEGLALLHQTPCDLAVIALNLPDMDGLDVLGQARQTDPRTVVVISAQHASLESAVEAPRRGASDYLTNVDWDAGAGLALDRVLQKVSLTHAHADAGGGIQDLLGKIEAAKQEWEATVDSLPDLVCLVDDRGRTVRANRTVETWGLGEVTEVAGRDLHSLLHPGCTDPACYFPSFWERAMANSMRCQPDRYEVYDTVLERHLLLRTQPCRHWGRTSSAGATAVLVSDTTERRRAEEAEREFLRLKAELLDRVSHELRTPLFSIRGFASLILRGKVQNPEVHREFITRVVDQSDRLIALVDDLLDMSRLERGLLELEREVVQIRDITDRVLTRLEHMACDRSISLRASMSQSLPAVQADPRRVEQILVNLIDNAVKFTPAGGWVEVRGESRDGEVLLQVVDTGVGIPPEAMPHLFSKFYQVDGSATRRQGGTGLGLAISRGIVEAHGGRIWAESVVGEGSTFCFTLPVADMSTRGETQMVPHCAPEAIA
jgi:two-component system phosphate regulon sensor histidine kinase PhoR